MGEANIIEGRPRIVHYYGCVRCQCNHYELVTSSVDRPLSEVRDVITRRIVADEREAA